MTSEEKQFWAIKCLREKKQELGHIPRMKDFGEADRSRIKAYLGPWPRALEAAGLKKGKMEQVREKETGQEQR